MALDRYTWTTPKHFHTAGLTLEAWAEDGTLIEWYLDDHDYEIKATLTVHTPDGTIRGTDNPSDWPTIEKYVPRNEWPTEITGQLNETARPDQALLDSIQAYKEGIAAACSGGSDDDAIEAWLGDAYEEMTADQLRAFTDVWDNTEALMTEAVDADTVLSAAHQVIVGVATLHDYAQAEQNAHARYLKAVEATRGAMLAAAATGESITAIAKATGLTRRSVYLRLGRLPRKEN